MDTNSKILVECDESACEMFKTGHEQFLDCDHFHRLPVVVGWNYRLTVQRGSWESEWTVDVDVNTHYPEFSPDNAVTFATDLLRASTDCRALNSAPVELSTITKVLDIAASLGVANPDPREVLATLNA